MDIVRQKFPLLRLLLITCYLALFLPPPITSQPRDVQAQINPKQIESQLPYDPDQEIEAPAAVTHESTITGEVFDDTGAPLANARVRAVNPDNPEETFETTTGPDGKYALAVSFTAYGWETLQKFNIDLFKPGHTPQQTIVETVAERTAGAGKKFLKKLDSVVTRIGRAGGTHINEKGDVQIIIPQGALQQAADFRTTLYDHSQELPGPLPVTSQFTYAGDFDNEETPLSEPATVKIANSLGFAPGLQIPIGYYNPVTRQWDDSGNKATVDPLGEWLEYQTDHFSYPDINLPALPPPTAKGPTGSNNGPPENTTPEGTNRGDLACATRQASQVDMQSGNLNQDITLPGIRAMNQDNELKLVYNSNTAKPSAVIKTNTDLDSRYTRQPLARSVKYEIEGVEASAFYQNSWGRNAERWLWDATNGAGEIVSTGSYPYKVTLGNEYEGEYYTADSFGGPPIAPTGVPSRETVPKTTVVEGEVLINNQINSSFGAGWSLAHLQRLHPQPEGNMVLTEGNGSTLMFKPCSQPPSGLVSWWPGDGNADDFLGLNHGVLKNGANFRGGKVGEAFNFDGVDDFITFGKSIGNFKTEDFSIDFWMTTSFRGQGGVFGKRPICDHSSFWDIRTPLGLIDFELDQDDRETNYNYFRSTIAISDGNFHHVAFVRQGKEASIYIDGVLNNSNSTSGVTYIENTAECIAGKSACTGLDGTTYFTGQLDEIDIFNRALEESEISAIFNAGSAGKCKGPTIYYISPTGDFSKLVKNIDGTIIRTLKDGTKINFNADGFETSEVDRNGNTISYTYNAEEQLDTISYPGNVSYTFAYDPTTKKLASITDSTGRTTQFTIDANGDLVEIIKPDTSSRKFTYTPDHLMAAKTDENNNTTDYVYDTHSRIKETITPEYDVWDGTQIARERESTFFFPSESKGLINDFEGDLGTPENPAPIIDPNTLTDEIQGPCGCNAVKGYTNQFGSWTETYDGLNRKTTYSRDADNNTTKITYPNGRVSEMIYDAKGNLLTLKENYNSAVTTFTYEPVFNQVKSIQDPLSNITTFEYDAKGNLIQIKDDNNTITEMTYLNNGSLETITQAKGIPELENTTRFTYYADTGNLWTTTDPLSHTTEMTYNSAGNLKTILDAEGMTTTYTYDPRNNNLRLVEDNLGNITRYQYDNGSNLRYVTDAKDQTTEFRYNEINLLSSILNPLNKTKTFTYNADRLLGRILDAMGQEIRYEYDAAHQLKFKYLPEETVSYGYDTGGNLNSVQDSDSNLSFTYDPLNRLTTTQTLAGGLQPVTTQRYTYDKNNNRETWVNVQNTTFKYLYDNLNRLMDIKDSTGATTYSHYGYDALSRRTGLQYLNGTSTTYSYDLASQLNNLTNLLSNLDPLSSFSYIYNDVGYRKAMTTTEGTHRYAYDDLYRLEGMDYPQIPDEAFTYDSVGNRLTKNASPEWTYNDANRLLDDGRYRYTYDANGNMTQKILKANPNQKAVFTYNSENQLISVQSPVASVQYAYDGLGRRIQKDINGVKTKYVYDNEDVIAEYDGSNILQATYLHGPSIDEPVYMERGGQKYYYHADGLGSITELTDASGTVVQTYEYDAFGNIVSGLVASGSSSDHGPRVTGDGISNPFTYTGREFDSESGLYFYRARYYDAKIGRFIQEDPRWDVNLYPMVDNNPVNFIDPLGLFSFWDLADVYFFLESLKKFKDCPDAGTGLDLGLNAISLLPIVPSLALFTKGDDFFKAGKKIIRDKGLKGLPNEFKRWLHREVKLPGDPDFTPEEIKEWFEEWLRQGKPGG